MADSNYREVSPRIDRYKNKIVAKEHEFINNFYKIFLEGKNITAFNSLSSKDLKMKLFINLSFIWAICPVFFGITLGT